jgi:hypothetical protein
MAHARMNRKGFLKSLGVAAAACTALPASAAVARVSSATEGAKPVSDLPRQTKAATRIIAFRAPGV